MHNTKNQKLSNVQDLVDGCRVNGMEICFEAVEL
jgi:hypothetical protein